MKTRSSRPVEEPMKRLFFFYEPAEPRLIVRPAS